MILVAKNGSTLTGLGLNSGMLYPLLCNSAIAALNCGMEALIFGSLIILALGVFAISPSIFNSSSWIGAKCHTLSIILSEKLTAFYPKLSVKYKQNKVVGTNQSFISVNAKINNKYF